MQTGPGEPPPAPNPPPGFPDDYANLAVINGDNVITTDESEVTVSGISDGFGASVFTYLVPYAQFGGMSTIAAESSAVSVTDLGYKDANGNEVGSYSATLPTSGLAPGIYVAESDLEFPNNGSTVYENSGADSLQIISVEPHDTQVTALQLAGTNPEISTDGRYLVYTAINEYNEPENTGDVYQRDLQTGAEVDLTATGQSPVGVFAANHTASGNGSTVSYPNFTSANGEYTFGTIKDFNLNPDTGGYNPLPVVTNNSTGWVSVIGGIGVQKYFVGSAIADSDNGDVVLSAEPYEVSYHATGSSFIESADPQLYISYLNPAPILTINPVNGNNQIASNVTTVTITGNSSAIGQTVEIDFGAAGAIVGTATVSSLGRWSFTFNPTTLNVSSLYIEASVMGADGTPARTAETATVVLTTGPDTFTDNTPATSGPQAGHYLWSYDANWSSGLPINGDSVTLSGTGIDDIATLALTTLIANGEVVDVEGGLLTMNTLSVDDDTGIAAVSDANGAASIVNVIIGTITGSDGLFEALGSNASLQILDGGEPAEIYEASDGGRIIMDSLSSSSKFGFGGLGTLALVVPGAGSSGLINNVGLGDVLELPGTSVIGVSFGASALEITTSSGIYDFTDVDFGAGVGSYVAVLDANTGLEAITFTTKPADVFQANDIYNGVVPLDGVYLWSDGANWASGVTPTDGADVSMNANGIDSIDDLSLTSLTLAAGAALDLIGEHLSIGSLVNSGVIIAQGGVTSPDVTITVGSITTTADAGIYGADGAGAVFIDKAPINSGVLFADGGGLLEITSAPGSAALSYYGALVSYYDGPGTIALSDPGATIATLLEYVTPEDVLELPGSSVNDVKFGTASITITTNAGTYTFSDVSYGASVTGYTAAFDAATGLEAITFTGPAQSSDQFTGGVFHGDYPTLTGQLWSTGENWSDGVPRNGAAAVIENTGSDFQDPSIDDIANLSLSSLHVLAGGELLIASSLVTDTLTVDAGALLDAQNTLTVLGTTLNDADITTDPTTIIFDGAVTGTGTIEISAGSDVIFNGSVASTETIKFLSDTGTLTINDPGEFSGMIEGSGQEDIACFVAGTNILTADGELVPVETLRKGDKVEILSGEAAQIIWIGRRHIPLMRHHAPQSVQPVLITAGALGQGLPWSDLAVSPDHAFYLDGHLIPAKALINGFTVRQLKRPEVTYYHIELAEHGVLLAEGAPAESYIDTGNRNSFENGGAAIALYPDFGQTMREQKSCAPFAESGPVVEAVRQRILDHAGIATTNEPALRIRYETGDAIIESRSGVPGELTADPRDRRRLGVKINRLESDGEIIPLDHPALAEGWHGIEPDGRWTNGNAVVPLALIGKSGTITIGLAATMTYPCQDRTESFAM